MESELEIEEKQNQNQGWKNENAQPFLQRLPDRQINMLNKGQNHWIYYIASKTQKAVALWNLFRNDPKILTACFTNCTSDLTWPQLHFVNYEW